MSMTFNTAEQAVINAVKANIQIFINNKEIFWNGITTDCVIAGGFFASAFREETFKDIDVFILNRNSAVYEALTDYPNHPNGDVWQIRDKDAGQYLQNPHIHGTATNTTKRVQYILTDYTSRKELLDSFDYLHTTISYVPKEDKLYITRGAFVSCRRKELIANGNHKPKKWRESKFMNRGWHSVNTNPHKPQTYSDALNDTFQQLAQQSAADLIEDMMKHQGTNAYNYLTK